MNCCPPPSSSPPIVLHPGIEGQLEAASSNLDRLNKNHDCFQWHGQAMLALMLAVYVAGASWWARNVSGHR